MLTSFLGDFTKYNKRMPQDRLEQVLNHIPMQLGDKFQYSRVTPDIPSAALKKSLTLLCMARLCHQVKNTDASGLPLAARIKERIFKVIFLDIGLTSGLLDLALHEQTLDNKLRLANEGGLAEQFIGQTL